MVPNKDDQFMVHKVRTAKRNKSKFSQITESVLLAGQNIKEEEEEAQRTEANRLI